MYRSNSYGKIPDSEVFDLQKVDTIRHSVYVLLCRDSSSYSREKKLALNLFEEEPYWLKDAVNAPERIYVGYSATPQRRVFQHGSSNGARFTKQFQPVGMLDLWDNMSESQARSYEEDIATRIRETTSFYVYQY